MIRLAFAFVASFVLGYTYGPAAGLFVFAGWCGLYDAWKAR